MSFTGRDLPDDGVPLSALRPSPRRRRRAVVTRAQGDARRAQRSAYAVAEYTRGESVEVIRRDLGVSDRTVYDLLRAAGVERVGWRP